VASFTAPSAIVDTNYGFMLEVTDNGGLTSADIVNILNTHINVGPNAIINGPSNGTLGTNLMFDAVSSTNLEGDTLSYTWNMGDGSDPISGNSSYVYNHSSTGSFNVTVTVSDGAESDTDTLTIVITVPPLVIQSYPQSAYVNEGSAATFSVAARGTGLNY